MPIPINKEINAVSYNGDNIPIKKKQSSGSIQITTMPTTSFMAINTFSIGSAAGTLTDSTGATTNITTADFTSVPAAGTALSVGEYVGELIYNDNNFYYNYNVVAGAPWSTATDAQIIEMVEADRAGIINLQEIWNVGDTRTVNLSAMPAAGVGESHAAQTVELVLMDAACTGFTYTEATTGGRTTPRFIVGMKDCLNEAGYMNSSSSNTGGWSSSARRTWCNNVFKNALPSTLIPIFKQFTWQTGKGGGYTSGLNTTNDYFAIPPAKAILGSASESQTDESALYNNWSWYQTVSNRIKKVNGSANYWWESSAKSGASNAFCIITSSGTGVSTDSSGSVGIAPFGVI